MATLNTTNIKHASSGSNNIVLASDGKVTFPQNTGNILQVVSTTKTAMFSEALTQGAFSADAMSLSITPNSASNKILIAVNCFLGSSTASRGNITIYKAGSVLTGSIGDADGSKNRTSLQVGFNNTARGNSASGTYLDTAGGTSAITYSVRLSHGAASTQTIYLNQVHSESDNSTYSRSASTITLMEVAA